MIPSHVHVALQFVTGWYVCIILSYLSHDLVSQGLAPFYRRGNSRPGGQSLGAPELASFLEMIAFPSISSLSPPSFYYQALSRRILSCSVLPHLCQFQLSPLDTWSAPGVSVQPGKENIAGPGDLVACFFCFPDRQRSYELGQSHHHSYYPFASSLGSLKNKNLSLSPTQLALMLPHFFSDIPPNI